MIEMGKEFFEQFNIPGLREFLNRLDIKMPRYDHRWSPNDRNIESLLKVLQGMADSLKQKKLMPFPEGIIEPETTTAQVDVRSGAIVAHELRKFILAAVTQRVQVSFLRGLADFLPDDGPLNVFSLNYDVVIEQFCRRFRISCTDGFDKDGRWRPDSYSQAQLGVRLWKLHGSADWVSDSFGWPKRAELPGSWRRHLRSAHTASATAETALVWPAATKRLENALGLLHAAFQKTLTTCRVLIAAGYRFADQQIRDTVLQALENNKRMRILVLCGTKANSDAAKAELLKETNAYNDRVEVFQHAKIEEALVDRRLFSTTCEILARHKPELPQRSIRSAAENEVICLGDFSAVAQTGSELILATRNRRTQLWRFESNSGRLTPIVQPWRGWARGLATVDRQAIVADCARGGWKSGWGIAWKIHIDTGHRENALNSSLLDFAQAVFKTAQIRRGVGSASDFLKNRMLSWPTSVDAIPNTETVLITESRRLVALDIRLSKVWALSDRRFLNLMAVRHFCNERCLLLENVLKEQGVLWEFDYVANNLRPVLAGIPNATGLLITPTAEALITQGDDAPAGKIWRVNLATGNVSVLAQRLNRPGAMVMLGQTAVAVATAGALVRIRL